MKPESRADFPLSARSRQAATVNFLDINVTPGRGPHECAHFRRADSSHHEPWIGDGAINSWLAASWLTPYVAENGLPMVCGEGPDDAVVAQDNRWWDCVISVVALPRHALLTGNQQFLEWAEGGTRLLLAIAHTWRCEAQCGLFRGRAVVADGIFRYPAGVVEPGTESSFLLDQSRTHEVFCLSPNLTDGAAAYEALGEVAVALGRCGEREHVRPCSRAEAVGRHIRDGDCCGFLLILGCGDAPDRPDRSEHAVGLTLVLLECLPGIGRPGHPKANQTWLAMLLLGVVLKSFLGLQPQVKGMRGVLTLPMGIDSLRLTGIQCARRRRRRRSQGSGQSTGRSHRRRLGARC